jgi:MT0933-like antitoxin protein
MGFLDKVKGLVAKNADKVDTAIDKVGDIVDTKTQGKYAQHVDKVQDAAKKAVDGTQEPGPVPPTQPPASPPAPPQS